MKTGPDVQNDETYNLEGKVVTIRVNPTMLSQMISGARAQVDKSKRYAHGSPATGGLRFSPDWLGVE